MKASSKIMKAGLGHMTYALLFSFTYLLSLLPFSVLYRIAGMLYFIAYRVLRYRQQVVVQNLSRSFPGMSYGDIRRVTRSFYRYFCSLLAEMVKMMSVSEQQLMHRVKVNNPELLEYYHSLQRPVIVMLGHYGNWEYMTVIPKHISFEATAIYKPLSNKAFDKLMLRLRTRFGMRMLPVQQAARHILKQKQSGLYFFIADQSPAPEAQCQVTFLNQSTSMFNGAEKLAKAVNAVVLYMDIAPLHKQYWQARFSLITENPSATHTGEITSLFAAQLQQSITQSPEYWLWSHRRWKHYIAKPFSPKDQPVFPENSPEIFFQL